MADERIPPSDKAAERSVLGSALRDNACIADLVQALRRQDFYQDAHQKIYQAALDLYDAGKPVDLVTLAAELQARKFIEDIGGYAYLAELWDAAPTAANAIYYAGIVRDHALLREIIGAGTEMARSAWDRRGSGPEIVEEAARTVFGLVSVGADQSTQSLIDCLRLAGTRIDDRSRAVANGETGVIGAVPTGFMDIDGTVGGIYNGELVIVAARPGVGKTSFATCLAKRIAEDVPVLFVSLEQSRIELAERILCAQSRVDSFKLRTGRLDSADMERLMEATGPLRKAKMFIDDQPSQTMLRLAANCRRLRLRDKIGCVIVDYLQLIEPDNSRAPRQEQVSAISRRLKLMARELKIPVICLAQLNRNVEDRADHRPRLSDLRESGSIEQDADSVWLLHRPEMYEGDGREGEVDLIVAKNRNGPLGTVTLTYLKKFMAFEDFAAAPPFAVEVPFATARQPCRT